MTPSKRVTGSEAEGLAIALEAMSLLSPWVQTKNHDLLRRAARLLRTPERGVETGKVRSLLRRAHSALDTLTGDSDPIGQHPKSLDKTDPVRICFEIAQYLNGGKKGKR